MCEREGVSSDYNKYTSLKACKAFVFDMDGTLILGKLPAPCSAELVTYLREKGFKTIVVTNNSSVSNADHALILSEILGIPFNENDIYSSLDHIGKYLMFNWKNATIFPLLTQKAKAYLAKKYGLKFTDKNPDLILVGFDKELTYDKLEKATLYVQQGIPWILAHPDYRCPTEKGYIPDAGSIAKLIELTTNTSPFFVGGKPSSDFLIGIANILGFDIGEICFVGDRLYTDIAMTLNSGAHPILLLSGETSERDLKSSDIFDNKRIAVFRDPCHLLNHLREIF